MERWAVIFACVLLPCCEGLLWQPSQMQMANGLHCQRVAAARMGRAEKRMAKKRQKKGAQYQGGRPLRPPGKDVLSQSAVSKRLSEVPVFGITLGGETELPQTETGFYAEDGTVAIFYTDLTEAQRACDSLKATASSARVVGRMLDQVYFDRSHCLKPSASAVAEAATIPAERKLVPSVRTPLFCIDGMQTTSKDSGVSSLPMFFSKAELLQFATPVYGAEEASRSVLMTDLEVVVENMIKGPAGLLRDAKFFAAASALSGMDSLEATKRQDVFGTQGSLEAQQERGLLGGLFP